MEYIASYCALGAEMYKIGVISDTHGLLRTEVEKLLGSCDVILHSGDIDKQEILERLRKIAPVYAVRGNADREWAEYLPLTLDIILSGLRIYMIHDKKQISDDVSDRDIIIYGHSHKYDEKRLPDRGAVGQAQSSSHQLWLNPGSCGPRRFRLPVTMAVIEVEADHSYQVRRIELQNDASDRSGQQSAFKAARAADRRKLVQMIIRDINRKIPPEEMAVRHGISVELAEQICRLYVTHPGIDAEGIINKMELKGL